MTCQVQESDEIKRVTLTLCLTAAESNAFRSADSLDAAKSDMKAFKKTE